MDSEMMAVISIKDLLKSNKGLAMPLAVLLIFVVSVLSTALLVYSSNDFLQFTKNKHYKKAQYLARTGVEVTMKAWESIISDTNVPRETRPVYMLEDGIFSTPAEGEDAPENSIGYYTVKVNPNDTKTLNGKEIKVITFDSTAVVGEETATASAYTVLSIDAYQQGWYTSGGTPVETGMTTINSSVVDSSLWWGSSVSSIKGHVFPGNIQFTQPNSVSSVTFTLNANQKLAYAGKALYFELPISLRNGTNSQNVLVLSGGDIILNEDVELYAYYGLFNSGIGTLVLSVMEDYEHDDPNTIENAKCGKVYFGGDVYITIARFLGNTRIKLFSRGDVYYFRGTGGLDLVKYYVDNHGTGSFISALFKSLYPSTGEKYDMSSMRKINPDTNANDDPEDLIPPHPDEQGTVIWQ